MSTQSYIGQAALDKKMRADLGKLKLFNVVVGFLFLLLVLVPITHISGSNVELIALLSPTFWTSLLSPIEIANVILIVVALIVIAYPITSIVLLFKGLNDIEFYRPRVAKANLIFVLLFAILYGVYYSQGWITLTEGLLVNVTLPLVSITIPSVPSLFVLAIVVLVAASLGNSIIGENNRSNRKIVGFQMLALIIALGAASALFVPYYIRTDSLPILGYDLFSIPGLIYHASLELMLTANSAALPAIETIGVVLLNTIVLLIGANVLIHYLTLVLGKPMKWLSLLGLSLLLVSELASVYFALTYFEIWPTSILNFLGTLIVLAAVILGFVVAIIGIKPLDEDRYPAVVAESTFEVKSEVAEPTQPVKVKKPAKPFKKLGLIIFETLLALAPIALFFIDFYTRLGVSISVFDFVVFGNITNANVIAMFALNAANWPFAFVDFALVSQYTLITLVILFDLNILIRLVSWLAHKPLRILSLVWSIISLIVVGAVAYLSFTYFEIYWNQPLTYLGLLIAGSVAFVHLLIALLSKPHKAKVVEPVKEEVAPEEVKETTNTAEEAKSAVVSEEVIKEEPVRTEAAKKSAPIPLPTVELESLNVFGEAAAPIAPKAAPTPKPSPVPEQPKPVVSDPVKVAEPIAEPIRPISQPEPKPVASSDDDEVEAKPISFIHANGVDSLYQELNDAEKAEFRKFYIDPGVDHKVPYLQYVVGGDNSQYFSNVFYYMSRYRKIISISLLTKIYDHIRVMLGDDHSEISHLNTQLIRIYFSRRSEPGVMKLLIAKCKEDIELNLNVLKVHDVYLYSFKRLVMVHEGMGNYAEAKRWVEMALELNLDDKTKGGYPARLERIKSKIQLYTDN